MRPEFQQQLNILDKSINSDIGDPVNETDIDKFEVEMMSYEDAALQEMKPVDPEEAMTDQDDAPTP